jgi:hypothetical protein
VRNLGAIVVVMAAIAPAGLAASTAPHLRIVDESPLRLRGNGFMARERVTLKVTLGQITVKRLVTTTAGGSFTALFTKMRLDHCQPLRVVAVGAKGDRASFELETFGCPNVSTN